MVIRHDGMVFFVAGINYRKCDTEIRGRYALNAEMIRRVLEKARLRGLPELFVLSTCNRTEIYGLAHQADSLITLLCEETQGSVAAFRKAAYIYKQRAAAAHLYEVAAGLDSQILGDYEIVGQLKNAMKLAKAAGTWGSFLDRLMNSALRSSKVIKNETSLSGGTVSVSFAAVQWIRQQYPKLDNTQILLIGAGKIGRNTCKNLVDYAGAKNITILNRTKENAMALAKHYGAAAGSLEELDAAISTADIIVTATASSTPFIHGHHFTDGKSRLIIDLSVPANVSPDSAICAGVRLVRVDELSQITDETLSLRTAEIPKVRQIIDAYLEEFIAWNERRKYAVILNNLKQTLFRLQDHPHVSKRNGNCSKTTHLRINKVVRDTAKKLDIKDAKGCHFISALNQFIH